MLSWKSVRCEVSLVVSSVERIKTFFEQLKRKLYNASGGARLSQTRSATAAATLESIRESQEYKFASNMAIFLDTLMQENSNALNKYLSESGNVFLCHCYS